MSTNRWNTFSKIILSDILYWMKFQFLRPIVSAKCFIIITINWTIAIKGKYYRCSYYHLYLKENMVWIWFERTFGCVGSFRYWFHITYTWHNYYFFLRKLVLKLNVSSITLKQLFKTFSKRFEIWFNQQKYQMMQIIVDNVWTFIQYCF